MLKGYTVRWNERILQIDKAGIFAGLRQTAVRVEQRRDGEVKIAFEGKFLAWTEVTAAERIQPTPAIIKPLPRRTAPANSPWRQGYRNLKPRSLAKFSAG